ncbi:hypothetical protein EPA93_13030 [Ktedonosporobacter rubrisoli]|uniref:Sugar-binding cellulase-like protein n=1 Tax=Ktedonosporobacter rubrisoli TaxID=2509675 RepID=A0A4P6JNJ1_KTERU|nr:cellulase-like family protein [Ktedonosporobacter rubrisoli]QBD76878.1 hypothetical protein EPA93_13030 [Ktedonosporobacter rubrisoli]
MSRPTVTIPAHLPRRLTISLWDFSWYTQTMEGEPFHDLDRAFAEAVERGYNTVRICAMPYLLFGPQHDELAPLRLANLGGEVGQRTRWYNAKGGAVLDGRKHLLALFRAAQKHNCYIILSSWEYQQSPSFSANDAWYRALMAIPPRERFMALAQAMGNLISFLKEYDLAERIAYAELHNEVEYTRLTQVAREGEDALEAEKPYLEEAVAAMRALHPDILMTVCYASPILVHMRSMAENVQVAHFHLYIYGVLEQLLQEIGLRSEDVPLPNPLSRRILRPDAPPLEAWKAAGEWRQAATGMDKRLFYVHDWADPDQWDLWLYEHYAAHREAMRQIIKIRLAKIADWAQQHGLPAVIGEGYVGYTPLLANFEEGPVGKDIAEYAVETCLQHDFWGYILCSNSAPQHPFWQDVAWQQRMNAHILHS